MALVCISPDCNYRGEEMSITKQLNQIKNAIYGKEVRSAIHDAIKECYNDASVNNDNANMEVKMARGIHNTLNDRLDKTDEMHAQTNAKLSTKVNYLDIYNNKDIAICVGYSYDDKKAGLFVTHDGKNISRCGYLNFPARSWDMGITFYDGYFYICYDWIDENFNDYETLNPDIFTGGNRIKGAKTKDFLNFEYWDIPLPLEFKQTFSPKFFIDDNGDKYMVTTLGDCKEIVTDFIQKPQYKKYCYITKFDDDFKTPRWTNIINLRDGAGENGTSKLDAFLYKHNDEYHLFIKDEDNDYIQQYKSYSPNSGYSLINEFKGYGRTEAPSIMKINDEYILFMYEHEYKYNYFVKSTDLVNWSEPFRNNLYVDKNIMNASFYVCNTDETKKIVYDYVKESGAKPFTDDFTKTYTTKMFDQAHEIKGDIKTLKLTPNTLYYITGTTSATITSLDKNELSVGDVVYFQVQSESDLAMLNIKSQDRLYFNGTGDLILNKNYTNDILTLVCVNEKKECFISGVINNNLLNTIEEQGFTDTNSGLTFIFYKNNRTVSVMVSSKFTKVVPKNTVQIASFTVPTKFRPKAYSHNSYLLANGEYNNMKIDSDGKLEFVVGNRDVTANSSWFECSMSYLTYN